MKCPVPSNYYPNIQTSQLWSHSSKENRELTSIPSRSLEEYVWTSFPRSLFLYLIIYKSQHYIGIIIIRTNSEFLPQKQTRGWKFRPSLWASHLCWFPSLAIIRSTGIYLIVIILFDCRLHLKLHHNEYFLETTHKNENFLKPMYLQHWALLIAASSKTNNAY